MMSPAVVIGFVKPLDAAAHAGAPPTTVSTWPVEPIPSAASLPEPSSISVALFDPPDTALPTVIPPDAAAHAGAPPTTVSTWPVEPIPSAARLPEPSSISVALFDPPDTALPTVIPPDAVEAIDTPPPVVFFVTVMFVPATTNVLKKSAILTRLFVPVGAMVVSLTSSSSISSADVPVATVGDAGKVASCEIGSSVGIRESPFREMGSNHTCVPCNSTVALNGSYVLIVVVAVRNDTVFGIDVA